MKMMEDMARRMDSGFDGIEGIDWCRLIYIPHPKTLKKNVSAKVKEWVRLSEFEIALDEQMEKGQTNSNKKLPNAAMQVIFHQ